MRVRLLGMGLDRVVEADRVLSQLRIPVAQGGHVPAVDNGPLLGPPLPLTFGIVAFSACGEVDAAGMPIFTPSGLVTKAAQLVAFKGGSWPAWADEPADDIIYGAVVHAAPRTVPLDAGRAVALTGEPR